MASKKRVSPKRVSKKQVSKKVVKHLKDDIETFKHEASEDKKLIKTIKKTTPMRKRKSKKAGK